MKALAAKDLKTSELIANVGVLELFQIKSNQEKNLNWPRN